MNISTLAKILGVSISDLRDTAQKNSIRGFHGRNTRIPYNSAMDITKIIRPDKANNLKNDDKIYLPSSLTVAEFSEAIGKQPGIVVRSLIMNGIMATLNEHIDYDTAELIAEELRVPVFPEAGTYDNVSTGSSQSTAADVNHFDNTSGEGRVISRTPVVTVMGHVDHGKTTLLDTIRQANVAGGEAGAITQHISSYQIDYKDTKITFVDTPGHEAFTAMRARGSQLADFIILVVAASEGPKPQTVEVIERAKISKTPVIVAINKIDLPTSDIEKTKLEVSNFGLVPEDWGGDTPYIPISAKNNENLDTLLDTILLHAEVAELKGTVDKNATGVVVECHKDSKLGVATTVLVTSDALRMGDVISCATFTGKIKRLENSEGKMIGKADLASPALLLGLPEVVNVGEEIRVHKNQKEAVAYASEEEKKRAARKIITNTKQEDKKNGNQIDLAIIADVQGSLEALKESILKIPQDKVKINIKMESIGEVSETDVEFAKTSSSTILAFHTGVHKTVEAAVRNGVVQVIQSDIIYEILNWLEEEILKNTTHEIKTIVLGSAEVLAVFKSDKPSLQVFGGEVKDGKIFDDKPLRLIRNKEEIARFEIEELQRDKVKSKEINISQQFGVSVRGKAKIEVGDILQSVEDQIVT
jgi:translation initiation factor IF-2